MGSNTERNTSGIFSTGVSSVENYDGCKSYHFRINLPSDDKYIHEAEEAEKGSYSKQVTLPLYPAEPNSKSYWEIHTEYVEE